VVRACVLIILNIWKVENNPGERRQRERWAILDSSIWHSAQFFIFSTGLGRHKGLGGTCCSFLPMTQLRES
jgi:hypothetical protein